MPYGKLDSLCNIALYTETKRITGNWEMGNPRKVTLLQGFGIVIKIINNIIHQRYDVVCPNGSVHEIWLVAEPLFMENIY